MKFEAIEPLVKLRTTYEGHAVSLSDPKQMADPSKAFRENPHKQVSIDLLHEAVAPVYGQTNNERADADPEQEFGRAHYEQHMHVTGTVTIDGETTQIDAYGLRDHSWGPRYWQNIYSYRWLTCSFGPDLNIMVSEIRRTPEERTQGGVVIRDGKLERIKTIEIDSAFEDERIHHQRMTANLGLGQRRAGHAGGQRQGLHPAPQPPRRHDHPHRRRHDGVPLPRPHRARHLGVPRPGLVNTVGAVFFGAVAIATFLVSLDISFDWDEVGKLITDSARISGKQVGR